MVNMIQLMLRTFHRSAIALLVYALITQPAIAQQGSISVPTVGRLPIPLMMHGSAVVGNRLYTIGGNKQRDGWTDDVHSAEILADGKVGGFRKEASLPELRAYLSNGVEVVNGSIYVISGSVAKAGNTQEAQLERAVSLLWARVEADGSIKEWKRAPLPEGELSFTATCSNKTHLVVAGGRSQGKISDHVYVSALDETGAPLEWKLQAIMPSPRWFHSAGRLGDRIFVWGGLADNDRSKVDDTVYSAPFSETGAVGPWRIEASMPQPVFTSTGGGWGDLLVSVGGRYANSYPTNAIWTARLANGRIADWTILKSDLRSRVFHSLAMHQENGWVYVTGGRDKTTPAPGDGARLDSIQAFRVK